MLKQERIAHAMMKLVLLFIIVVMFISLIQQQNLAHNSCENYNKLVQEYNKQAIIVSVATNQPPQYKLYEECVPATTIVNW